MIFNINIEFIGDNERERQIMGDRVKSNESYYCFNSIGNISYLNNNETTHSFERSNIDFEKTNSFRILKSTLYDVINFIAYSKKEINTFILNSKMFIMPEQPIELLNYSFTSTKIQKILIISLMKFYVDFFKCNSLEITEENIKKFCPITDFDKIIVKECGFGIEFDFNGFPVDYFYDQNLHSDVQKSLFHYLKLDYSPKDVIDKLLVTQYFNKSRMSVLIDKFFERKILETYFNFVLFNSTDLGQCVLNLIKDPNCNYDSEISLYTLIELVESHKTDEENILINYLYR